LSERRALAASRVALGLILLVRTTPLSRWLPWDVCHVTPPLLGWPEHGFRAPWHGLALPAALVIALCVVRTVAAAAFTVGAWTRAAGGVTGAAAFVVMSQDAFGFKFTLYTLFLAIPLVAMGRLWVVQTFVASVYVWSGIAKLQTAWLGGETLRLLHEAGYLMGGLADVMLATPERCHVAAWVVVLVELALGPLLLVPRTRIAGVVLAVGMHAAYEWAAHPDVFGWIMLALLVTFLGRHAERPVTS
jgi:hypothetical protein